LPTTTCTTRLSFTSSVATFGSTAMLSRRHNRSMARPPR
jgi:hypothetical protein